MSQPDILGKFAGIVGLLGVALYFTGWIYRWSYFGFFKLEVTTLDFPLESFFMVPLQVFFGDFIAIVKTFAAFLGLVMLILLARLLRTELISIANWFHLLLIGLSNQVNWISMSNRLGTSPMFNSGNFPPSLLNDFALVVLILFFLFHLANNQGNTDAWRDAATKNSTLPAVALVAPENNLGLGRRLDDLTDGPNLKNWRIIGDDGLYNDILGSEVNSTRVWRLLLHRNGLFYVFLQMPSNSLKEQRPSVVAVKESDGGNQLLILSPEASKK